MNHIANRRSLQYYVNFGSPQDSVSLSKLFILYCESFNLKNYASGFHANNLFLLPDYLEQTCLSVKMKRKNGPDIRLSLQGVARKGLGVPTESDSVGPKGSRD